MEWDDMEKLTVVKLREEALKHKELKDVQGMTKAKLLDALTGVLGIEKPYVQAIDKGMQTKAKIKHHIKELKVKRNKLVEAHDHKGLKAVRREIHHLKRKIRKTTNKDGKAGIVGEDLS